MHNFYHYYHSSRWGAYAWSLSVPVVTNEARDTVKVSLQQWLIYWLTACRDQLATVAEVHMIF